MFSIATPVQTLAGQKVVEADPMLIIAPAGEREHSAAELQKILAVPKANLSQHLAILKAVGIVRTRREGRHIFCALAIPAVKRACGMIQEVLRARFQNRQSLKF
jgi:DNA-binding transcriptional ArsR family regulator